MASKSVLGSLVQTARIACTQGSADAFATARLETGISTASRYGWLLDRVDFVVAGLNAYVATADADFTAQIVQGAVPTGTVAFTSPDLIAYCSVSTAGIAAAVAPVAFSNIYRWDAPENYVVVDPSLHITLDSSNQGTLTCTAIIHYYPVELSELDILRMIALR